MPWNPSIAEIEGIIDGNLKSSPPAPPQSNSAAVVRSLLKSIWGAMARRAYLLLLQALTPPQPE
ncbi:hypothetical protein [Dyadobacter sp. 676]|uniref:Uncharacterized protein n=1 Tax=Dyadobacter sp. 676 TaxID=3088362 RepID=A0AAU8FPC3_9BACT